MLRADLTYLGNLICRADDVHAGRPVVGVVSDSFIIVI